MSQPSPNQFYFGWLITFGSATTKGTARELHQHYSQVLKTALANNEIDAADYQELLTNLVFDYRQAIKALPWSDHDTASFQLYLKHIEAYNDAVNDYNRKCRPVAPRRQIKAESPSSLELATGLSLSDRQAAKRLFPLLKACGSIGNDPYLIYRQGFCRKS